MKPETREFFGQMLANKPLWTRDYPLRIGRIKLKWEHGLPAPILDNDMDNDVALDFSSDGKNYKEVYPNNETGLETLPPEGWIRYRLIDTTP